MEVQVFKHATLGIYPAIIVSREKPEHKKKIRSNESKDKTNQSTVFSEPYCKSALDYNRKIVKFYRSALTKKLYNSL